MEYVHNFARQTANNFLEGQARLTEGKDETGTDGADLTH